MKVEERILDFLKEEIEDTDVSLDVSTPLFSSRLLDSMDLVAFIAFLEKTFGMKIKPEEVSKDNFDTVKAVAAFIKSRSDG